MQLFDIVSRAALRAGRDAPREPGIAKRTGRCLDRASQELFAYPSPHSMLLQSLCREELRVTALWLLFMVIMLIKLFFAQ